MRRKSAIIAFLVSFSVYLIPLIGPHAAPLLGEMFFGGMYRGPLWFLTDVAAGLILQLVAFTVVYLFLQKRNLIRGLTLLCAVPAVFISTQILFMLWIPSMFLIESDTASDTGSWPVECTADDAWIVEAPTPHRALGESLSEVLIQTSKADYGVLSMSGCMVTPLTLPKPTLQPDGHVDFTIGIDYVVPGAAILFYKLETSTGKQTWKIARRGRNDLIEVERWANVSRIISGDGEWKRGLN